MNYILPFLSIVLGVLFVVFGIIKSHKHLKLILAFSGAFLLSTAIISLLPEVFAHSDSNVSYWILAGIVIQIILESLSKGAEHGHIHVQDNGALPWSLFIGLSLHAFIEGLPINEHQELLWAIVVHKLPIAMLLAAALWKTTTSIKNKVGALLIFALITPFGTYLHATISILQPYAIYITALVIGVMLHISTTIIFESANNHKFNASKIAMILLGLGLAALMH